MKVVSDANSLFEFGLHETAACGKALRELGLQESDLPAFAKRATLYFYEHLVDGAGKPACAAVRFCDPSTLTESRVAANGLLDVFRRSGLGGFTVCNVNEGMEAETGPLNYEVLYVDDMGGEQTWDKSLLPEGTKSVLGLGCRLPSGDFFALVLYMKGAITRNTVELFRTVTLNLRLALLRFEKESLLAGAQP